MKRDSNQTGGKLPAFLFFPGDWRRDPGVQQLSFEHRGIWLEILCLMHFCERRGVLLLNGAAMPTDGLARALGLNKQTVESCISTLLATGVASREETTGALVCRRMVKDERLRQIRSRAGRMGGNPALKPPVQDSESSEHPNLLKQPFGTATATEAGNEPATDSEKTSVSSMSDGSGPSAPVNQPAAQRQEIRGDFLQAVADACKWDRWFSGPEEQGEMRRAAEQLMAKRATCEEVRRRGFAWRRRHEGDSLRPARLAADWEACGS